MTTIYNNQEVEVVHQGFDIVIIVLNGEQKCVPVSETTLTKRERPKRPKY